MKVPMERAPEVIKNCLEMAEKHKVEYERWAQKADDESDPELRLYLEKMTESYMNIVNSMRSDADQLIEQLKAAGRPYRR